ncbi:MAG: hypothetical protein ABIE94_03410 [archaeon]
MAKGEPREVDFGFAHGEEYKYNPDVLEGEGKVWFDLEWSRNLLESTPFQLRERITQIYPRALSLVKETVGIDYASYAFLAGNAVKNAHIIGDMDHLELVGDIEIVNPILAGIPRSARTVHWPTLNSPFRVEETGTRVAVFDISPSSIGIYNPDHLLDLGDALGESIFVYSELEMGAINQRRIGESYLASVHADNTYTEALGRPGRITLRGHPVIVDVWARQIREQTGLEPMILGSTETPTGIGYLGEGLSARKE